MAPRPPAGSTAPVVRTVANRPDRIVFPWTDSLLSSASLRDGDPTVANLGMRTAGALEERAMMVNDAAVLARIRGELARAKSRQALAPAAAATINLASWHPVSSRSIYQRKNSAIPALWVAHERHIAHLAGPSTDSLLLDYPLAGTYEFNCQAYAGPWADSTFTHGGLVIEPFAGTMRGGSSIFPIGQSESLPIPWRLSRAGGFNRMTVQASPQKVRYLVNGHLFFEDDDPSPTCPWLGLFTYQERHSVWRELSLTGEPVVPREVRLTLNDRLEGWSTAFYNESQPRRRTVDSTDQYGNTIQVSSTATMTRRIGPSVKRAGKRPKAPIKLDDFDWAARDGVIHGRRVFANITPTRANVINNNPSAGTEADQSVISYFRPLQSGDVLTYEFLYEPGQIVVHPAVGRIAFLLEPEGVKVHWMTEGGRDLSGLAADNAVIEPSNRRGPAALPLQAGEWNNVRLAVEGPKVKVELNGQAVYERMLEPAVGREFGLFHYKDQTAAQARNVVLRGKWPESLDKARLDGLLAPDPAAPDTVADRRARHTLIGEPIFALEAGEIVERASKLPPGEAYAQLVTWVLPTPDHPVLRLAGDFSPSFPAATLMQQKAAASSGASGDGIDADQKARLQSGGELRAPALVTDRCGEVTGKTR